MLIECTLKREQAIEVPMGNETYVFDRDERGRRVAEVHNERHIECFLAVAHLYREAADAADEDAAAPPAPDGIILIKGIGAKLVDILAKLDPPVTTLEQIAAWTPEERAKVEGHLRFPGRIAREEWVEQAREILAARAAPAAEQTQA